jgi:phospholipid/cholesterol/gamma-HCH transport system permease protein
MTVEIRVERHADGGRATPVGTFDLAHAEGVEEALLDAQRRFDGCGLVELDLAEIGRIDGSGAALLTRFLDRLDAAGCETRIVAARNPEAERLVLVYRKSAFGQPATATGGGGVLGRLGATAAAVPATVGGALDFIGRCAFAVPGAIAMPRSVDWRSLPALLQGIGADALPVTGAANLLVGLIIGFIGVSQLGRFGAVAYVPELVVIAHFRELGPLVTAIVVAGRSGAGLASEIATMKVSEEIDALRSMGFDPVRWLVLPRCLALVVVVPLLTWVGDLLALAGGLAATTVMTDMPARAYMLATADAITAAHFLGGLAKTPFLALVIGIVACGQGLATQGGAAAVGTRTTAAVVLAIFFVIVVSAVFTSLYALVGL